MKKVLSIIMILVLVVILPGNVMAAIEGNVLNTPDDGWKRIYGTDQRFQYEANNVYNFNGNITHYNAKSIKFKFSGTKIRLLYHGLDIRALDTVNIDGQNYTYPITESKPGLASSGDYYVGFEKTDLTDGIHVVEISTYVGNEWYSQFSGIDVDQNADMFSPTDSSIPQNLTATPDGETNITLSWIGNYGDSKYNIYRSSTQGSGYTKIASDVTDKSYTDKNLEQDVTYYYVITAMDTNNNESKYSNEASAKISAQTKMTLTSESVSNANVGDTISVKIFINNAKNICAEDIKLAYDNKLLKYVAAKEADGMKINKESTIDDSNVRYIISCLGKDNAANGKKQLIEVTFQAIATGKAKVDITNGRVADNATLEEDILEENCGETTIDIAAGSDVNRSGETTLLDLGIDSWYYGNQAKDTDTSKYDADTNSDGTIDDLDLAEITKNILENKNYKLNA